MSLSYESRNYLTDAAYPQMQMGHEHDQDEFKHDVPRYPSPPGALSENPYSTQQAISTPLADDRLDLSELQKDEPDVQCARLKPIPKPARPLTKRLDGRYYCAWPGCTEEVRDFGRKCEWSKHMDKHDRPYKCGAEGCEKLPGFTYSGGLLRHEREVHNKHGGPRKHLNCPHPNCKRHTGKGFSRQENLNEHLRRVHTDGTTQQNDDDTEEDASESKAGQKRKRTARGVDTNDLREEMKRLRAENQELRRLAEEHRIQAEEFRMNNESQNAQTNEMMRQLQQLQHSMNPRMQAPQAPMM